MSDLQVLQKDDQMLWIDFTETKLLGESDFETAARNFVTEALRILEVSLERRLQHTTYTLILEAMYGMYIITLSSVW